MGDKNNNNAYDAYDDYDDWNEGEQEFLNYVPQTEDPRPWIMVGTVGICELMFVLAIFYLMFRRRRVIRKRLKKRQAAAEAALAALATSSQRRREPSGDDDLSLQAEDAPCMQPHNLIKNRIKNASRLQGWSDLTMTGAPEEAQAPDEDDDGSELMLGKDFFEPGGLFEGLMQPGGDAVEIVPSGTTQMDLPADLPVNETFAKELTAQEDPASGYNLMDDANSFEDKKSCSSFCRYLFFIMKRDKETNKLLKLIIPYTIDAVTASFFSLLTMGVVGRLLGTRELTAYIMVYYGIEITTLFLSGVMTSLSAVCSQAIGSEKYALAGQYVQIAVVIYLLGLLPQFPLWWYFVDDIMLKLDFDQESADIAQSYARIVFFSSALHSFSEGLDHLLEVSGYEKLCTVMNSIHSIASFVLSLLIAVQDNVFYLDAPPSLTMLGGVDLSLVVVFFFFKIMYLRRKNKWWNRYWGGLTGKLAIFNWHTVKFFLRAAIPLSFGYILSYGEWEVLFILAGRLGPAELAVWGR